MGKHMFYNVSSGVFVKWLAVRFVLSGTWLYETQNPSAYSSNIKKSWRFTAMPPLRPRVLHMANFTLSSWIEVEPGGSVGIVTTLRPGLSGVLFSAGAGSNSRPQNVQTASGAHQPRVYWVRQLERDSNPCQALECVDLYRSCSPCLLVVHRASFAWCFYRDAECDGEPLCLAWVASSLLLISSSHLFVLWSNLLFCLCIHVVALFIREAICVSSYRSFWTSVTKASLPRLGVFF